ncbi:hypothetical protein [Antrihabitans sp. YC2-6]|uniref:hypothetical protein n=1 Tax=Antrihabitans sp. YC2-6 TaxID=2799498 RepID=UPI0018F3C9E3|nr:hypothetical protein [Antrihabitans sp. YC2-6]MBJ8346709.1 hypothetical protein [Antrihabitans sp. YC2-6]
MTSNETAERLLDAAVDYVVGEFSGTRLTEVVSREVADVLKMADRLVIAEVVDAAEVKESIRIAIDVVGESPVFKEVAGGFADGIYDLSANESYQLGDLVDREHVAASIEKVLLMHTMQDRIFDRLLESPLVANVASSFVNRIVGEFAENTRKRAERIPGVKSLIKSGQEATERVRSSEGRLGQLAGKSAQFALRRTNNAVRDVLRSGSMHDAAMEIWDLQANEPIGNLREFLSKQDLHDLVLIAYELVVTARNKEYNQHVIDACVDIVFERYGSFSVTQLLRELRLSDEHVTHEIVRFLPPVVAALQRNGVLEREIRARLEPFFYSDAVGAILLGVADGKSLSAV